MKMHCILWDSRLTLFWVVTTRKCSFKTASVFARGIKYQASFFFPQQDVSEFTHKLLDWLEDAFQMKAEEET